MITSPEPGVLKKLILSLRMSGDGAIPNANSIGHGLQKKVFPRWCLGVRPLGLHFPGLKAISSGLPLSRTASPQPRPDCFAFCGLSRPQHNTRTWPFPVGSTAQHWGEAPQPSDAVNPQGENKRARSSGRLTAAAVPG